MFKVTKYPHGTFCWADCQSTDANKAKKFYVEVMGWGFQDMPMGEEMVYTMFSHEGEHVAALNQMQPEMQQQGIPSHWNCYVTVDDVDALAERVMELGGTVIAGPFDVFDAGRMMVLQDPGGANLSLWQAKTHSGAGLVNKPGVMIWNELATRDTKKAQDFYGPLLGWEFQTDENMGYTFFTNNGRSNGGMMQMDEKWGEMPPTWMVYFSVSDLDDTIEKAKAQGGQTMGEIIEAEGVGRFAVMADPAGAHCYAIQADNPQPWSE